MCCYSAGLLFQIGCFRSNCEARKRQLHISQWHYPPSWTILKDISLKRPSSSRRSLSSTSAGVPARSRGLWSSRLTDLLSSTSQHSWATLRRCTLLLGRNETQGENPKRNQNEKPSVTMKEQPGFKKENVRREKQLFQKLPKKIFLHLQLLHLQLFQLRRLQELNLTSQSRHQRMWARIAIPQKWPSMVMKHFHREKWKKLLVERGTLLQRSTV